MKTETTPKGSRRYAVLYSDGSFQVTDEGRDLITAQTRMGYHQSDEDSKLVEVDIKVRKVIYDKNPRFQVATEHSAECPTCGTEVFIEANDDAA